MFLALLRRLQRGDVALTVTAPFMLPYAVAAAAKLKRAQSVLIMHDLYPGRAGDGRAILQPNSLDRKGDAWRERADVSRAECSIVIIGRDTERLLLRYGEA